MVTAKYSCEICGKEFNTIEEAEACQNQRPKMQNIHIGDMVTVQTSTPTYQAIYTDRYEETDYWVIGFKVIKHTICPIIVRIYRDEIEITMLTNQGKYSITHRDYVDKKKRENVLETLERILPEVRLKRFKEVHEYVPKEGILAYLNPKLDTDDHPLDYQDK